jgi:hypothetical protein
MTSVWMKDPAADPTETANGPPAVAVSDGRMKRRRPEYTRGFS